MSGRQPDGTPPPGEDRRVKRDLETDDLEGVVIIGIDPALEETTRTGLAVVPPGAAPEDYAPALFDLVLKRTPAPPAADPEDDGELLPDETPRGGT